MNARLIDPDSAVASVATRLHATWPERVLRSIASEPESPITVRVRPGVSSSADVERIGFARWNEWREPWRNTGIRRANGVVENRDRRLGELTPDEAECYASLATSGAVTVRRIEQERIPLADARTALHQV